VISLWSRVAAGETGFALEFEMGFGRFVFVKWPRIPPVFFHVNNS
jgi:hypothetical protein